MSARDKAVEPASRISSCWEDPELAAQWPESFKNAPNLRAQFDDARDPLLKAQRENMGKTEKQRRDESARSSTMVKQHKPYPELRPKSQLAQGPKRASFNGNWMKEHRDARLSELDRQRQEQHAQRENRPENYQLGESMRSYSGPSR